MKEEYEIYYCFDDEEAYIGYLRDYENGQGHYYPVWGSDKYQEKVNDDRFYESTDSVDFISCMMKEENLLKGRRRKMYLCNNFLIYHKPGRSGESYLVYDRRANKGQMGYSEKNHSVPHNEPSAKDLDMDEWVNHYQFNKLEDGTYEAELDEAWYWGGSHTDGGTINREIPDRWQDLPYDEFLAKVIKLAAAEHFLFTVDDLKACPGLKEFFGYKED